MPNQEFKQQQKFESSLAHENDPKKSERRLKNTDLDEKYSLALEYVENAIKEKGDIIKNLSDDEKTLLFEQVKKELDLDLLWAKTELGILKKYRVTESQKLHRNVVLSAIKLARKYGSKIDDKSFLGITDSEFKDIVKDNKTEYTEHKDAYFSMFLTKNGYAKNGVLNAKGGLKKIEQLVPDGVDNLYVTLGVSNSRNGDGIPRGEKIPIKREGGSFVFAGEYERKGKDGRVVIKLGDKLEIAEMVDQDRNVADLVSKNFCNEYGEFTNKVNPLKVYEIISPDKVKEAWIKIPQRVNVSLSKDLPRDKYLKIVATSTTFIFENFPQYGQIKIKGGMMISLSAPNGNELLKESFEEPIPLDKADLPNNPVELKEIAKKCPVKILHSDSKGKTGHPWGHTAIEVNGKVYSYGRWGKVDKITGGTTGEGILFVFDGLEQYGKSREGKVKEIPIFGINAKQRKKIEHFFINKIKNGDTIYGHRRTQEKDGEKPTMVVNFPEASNYVIGDYDVFDTNCTTISLSALEAAGGNIEDIVEDYNLESKIFEDLYDLKIVVGAVMDTLDELDISPTAKLITILKDIIKDGKIDSKNLPVNKKGTIVNTGTEHDGKNILNLYYTFLSERYGTDHIRLPKNLYQALRSDKTEISTLNLNQYIERAYTNLLGKNKSGKTEIKST